MRLIGIFCCLFICACRTVEVDVPLVRIAPYPGSFETELREQAILNHWDDEYYRDQYIRRVEWEAGRTRWHRHH